MIDAVVNIFTGHFVYVYILYNAVIAFGVVVCVVWSDLFFALTDLLYNSPPYTIHSPHCQHFSPVNTYFNLFTLTVTLLAQEPVPHARTPKKRG